MYVVWLPVVGVMVYIKCHTSTVYGGVVCGEEEEEDEEVGARPPVSVHYESRCTYEGGHCYSVQMVFNSSGRSARANDDLL
ncbi:hypothetical protein RR46_02580 [Papilio xuthus]|uniref:Secreted protein n=1 Tax=Papilio xuthus TaxID=66420 RepID=A0A194Q299_PAPXU|nr:hypothetical protein RR46_02580 [Papilio xuthus]